MRLSVNKYLVIAVLLVAGSAFGYIQGKILGYDGDNISYSIYYPDYDRPYNAGESPVNFQIRFLVYWNYLGGKQEREEFTTEVDTVTNTTSDFRYKLNRDMSRIHDVTINLFIENRLSDTYVVNFKPAEPKH